MYHSYRRLAAGHSGYDRRCCGFLYPELMSETRHREARPRSVRSFVKRSGRLTDSQQRAMRELLPRYGVDFGNAPLDFDTLFGRHAPRVLEIGFGNGDSLLATAAANPDVDYLGVEVHEPGVGHCLLGIERAGLDNLRVINYDAIDVLREQVPAASLARVNLYFPDPWPKKRHHKRRILNGAFLELVASRLAPGGALHIATDWQNYAQYIDGLLEQSLLFEVDERREHAGDRPLDRPATRFEARGLKLGHRIWDWRLVS